MLKGGMAGENPAVPFLYGIMGNMHMILLIRDVKIWYNNPNSFHKAVLKDKNP